MYYDQGPNKLGIAEISLNMCCAATFIIEAPVK